MDKRFLALAALILVLQFVITTNTYLQWTAKGFFAMFVLPAAFILVTRSDPAKFGFNANKAGLSVAYAVAITLAVLPILVYYSSSPEFTAYYPIWSGQMGFLLAELLLFFGILGTEFFFRGFLLNALVGYTGKNYAIVLQALLYAMVHVGKPLPEVFLSFFAGLVFGYVAMRTKSILPSLMSHYSIAVIFDLLVIT